MRYLGDAATQRCAENPGARPSSIPKETDCVLVVPGYTFGLVLDRSIQLGIADVQSEIDADLATGTTSIPPLISTVLFYLLHYPHTLERLTSEVRAAFPDESSIRLGATLNSCICLTACLDETFRMNPQVANTLFRDVLPGGATVQGDFFAEGTMIGAAIWSIHRNEAHYANPHTFIPERYLGATEEERREAKRCWFPFSTGPRTCVGQRFAYVILSLVVARMLHRYDLRLSPEAPCCGKKGAGEKCTDRAFGSWIGLKVEGPVAQVKAPLVL